MALVYTSKKENMNDLDSLYLSKTLVHSQSSSQYTNAFTCDLVLTEAVECQRTTKEERSENCG